MAQPKTAIRWAFSVWALSVWASSTAPAWPQQSLEEQSLEESEPRVVFYSPRADVPAAGDVEMWVDVVAELPVTLVIFRVDGREIARFSKPPYQTMASLGNDTRAHRFEVLVRSGDVELGRATRETPTLRVDEEVELELRQLYVTVESEGGRVVTLTADDFEIFDDGERQTLVTFEGGDAPLAAAVLVDASVSMRGRPLEAAVAGARAFLAGLQPLDEGEVTLFSDRTLLRSGFLPAHELSGAALAGVSAIGGTALNDQLYIALKRLETRQGRRVVVLLSDGIDVHSVLDAADPLWLSGRSQSIVYWIELVDKRPSGLLSAWRDQQEHDTERSNLRRLVLDSGGRIVPIDDIEQAPAVFAEILQELREQYVLGYYPTVDRDDGAWHQVRLRVAGRGLEVRARRGYLDSP